MRGCSREALSDGSDWLLLGIAPWHFSRFGGFHAHLPLGCTLLMEDQAVEVVGQIGEGEFCLRACQAGGADEEARAVHLMREGMFDPGADR